MGYYLGVNIGSVNAKLALIDENDRVGQFYTGKVSSSPRAAIKFAYRQASFSLTLVLSRQGRGFYTKL
jgi:activator of 2-hydroxyglutaryl-CoA dehydratase